MESPNNDLQITQNMRKRTYILDREGDYWTKEDKDQLRTMFYNGVGITKIAITLQRTEPAVSQQIEKLNLYSRRKYKTKEKNRTHTQCACSTCNVPAGQCPRRTEGFPHE